MNIRNYGKIGAQSEAGGASVAIPNEDRLPFDIAVATGDYTQRQCEWLDRLGELAEFIAEVDNWFHFCLSGVFFIPQTGKYAEVNIYHHNGPEYQYRCIFYDRINNSPQVHEAFVDLDNLIEELIWYIDPSQFNIVYCPCVKNLDASEQSEVLASKDMIKIDNLYNGTPRKDGGERNC